MILAAVLDELNQVSAGYSRPIIADISENFY